MHMDTNTHVLVAVRIETPQYHPNEGEGNFEPNPQERIALTAAVLYEVETPEITAERCAATDEK
jgi:hypothetical protein